MAVATELTRRLNLRHPIIQAPMAGGGDTPQLVAAVSEAGGLGFIGAAYLPPAEIAAVAAQVRARTLRAFGINLFAPQAAPPRHFNPAPMLHLVAPYFAELGLPAPSAPEPAEDLFDARFAAAMDSGAAVFSFAFGLLPAHAVRAVRDRGMLLAGTATTVEDAIAVARAGADAVIAQGAEAGGHRSTFHAEAEPTLVGTLALVPQVADAVRVPVIASGGIMDGRGIAAVLSLGAAAAQMGTAFLTCPEAGVPEAYKAAILAAGEDRTRLTRTFSGRPARGIVNRFMTEVDREPAAILPFPIQNDLTRPLRKAAAAQGRAEFLSLWAGQGTGLARRLPAADLVAALARELDAATGRA